jgi:hypothetical protein
MAPFTHRPATVRQGHLSPRGRPARQGRRCGRHLLLQPRRPAANGGLPALEAPPAVVEATAVGIGRPYAYGLALGGTGGTGGIVHVLRSLLAEADLIMAVDGHPTLGHLTPEALQRVI